VKNGALQGGVIAPLYESKIVCDTCHFESNFGFEGGVVFSTNHGFTEMNNATIIKNFAFSVKIGEFLDTINL